MIKLTIFENGDTTTELEFHEDETVGIGRSDENRVVLKGKRMSREHCKIFFVSDQWKIVDLDSKNGTRVNDREIDEVGISDGDIIQLADFKIKVAIAETQPEAPRVIDGEDRTVFIERPATIPSEDTGKVSDEGLKGKFLSFLKVRLYAKGSKRIRLDDVVPRRNRMRKGIIIVSLAFVVLIVIVIALKPEHPTEETNQEGPVIKEEEEKRTTMEDLELERKVVRYMKRGKELFEKGDFSKALTRFQVVLDVAPENEEAIKYARFCQERIEKEGRIRRAEQEKERALKDRLDALVNRARELYQQEEYAKSKDLLAEAKYLSPSDKSVANLLRDVEEGLKAQKAQLEEETWKSEQTLAQVRKGYSKGERYYDQGKYSLALKEWEKVISTGLPCTQTDEARKRVPALRSMLMGKVKDNYDKGMQYYDNKQYSKALACLQKVVEVNPEYKDAKQKRDKILEIQENKAKKLYQEGLVYEGIGQMDKAIRKWKAVLKTLPVESHEYYKKANAKLGK